MRKHNIIELSLLLCATALHSQNLTEASELFERLEKAKNCRIYTDIKPSDSIKVKTPDMSKSTLSILEDCFKDSSFGISVMQETYFVLRDRQLQTLLVPSAFYEKETVDYSPVFENKTVKVNSENKIYKIGNPYIKDVPQKGHLEGSVCDFKTGEPVAGVNIIVKTPEWKATTTDAKGHFQIDLPTGINTLTISGIGIIDTRRQINLRGDGKIAIELQEETYALDEVTVTSGRIDNVKGTQMSVEKVQVRQIDNIPVAMGEPDIIKVIQSLPGVKTVGEASSGFNVRGGATDQNLIMYNGGTVYNPNHLFGFFSIFNSEIVNDAELYKSSIPARYGGRLSSVLDISSREGNKEKFTGTASIGIVTSQLTVESPIIKDRTSIIVSGRTTYSDWILDQLPEKSGYKDGAAGFYDIGSVISHKINENNNLTLSGYCSHDRFRLTSNQKYGYTNANASIKWKNFSADYKTTVAAGFDHYDYNNTDASEVYSAFKLKFGINQYYLKADVSRRLGESHTLEGGVSSTYYDLNPGESSPVGESLELADKLQKEKAVESAIYIGDTWDITQDLSVDGGIRYAMFNVLGPREYNIYQSGSLASLSTIDHTEKAAAGKIIKTYHGAEFRLSARYTLPHNFSIKAGFNSMQQFIHKLSNTAIMSPTDTWKLCDANVKPQKGWQTALGVYYNTEKNEYEFSVEGYYKNLSDYLDYRSGANIIMNHHIETDVINTEGRAYGVELMVKKPQGKLNGWLSYTYSKTELRQNNSKLTQPVNGGKWYPAEYDKPHDFKFVGNYRFTRRYSLSMNVDYSTGRPITLPAGKYYNNETGTEFVYYKERNSTRIDDYFRVDLSFNIEPTHHLTVLTHSSISFGVYNLTGRKNVYSIYYESDGNKLQGYKMSIFGAPIPFLSYNIRF